MIFLIGSVGGHLSELQSLEGYIRDVDDIKFVTFYRKNREKNEKYIYIIDPEQNLMKYIINAIQSLMLVARYRPKLIISAGAGLAVPMIIICKIIRIKVIHFEISCQIFALSKTGKFCNKIGIQSYVQSKKLTNDDENFIGNPYDKYQKISNNRELKKEIFVTVGNAKHDFKRLNNLIETLTEIYPNEIIVIQNGYTKIKERKNIRLIQFMTPIEFNTKIKQSNIIISHAGSGTIREILAERKMPVVFPRLVHLSEHNDISQLPLADYLVESNLAVKIENPNNNIEVKVKCEEALRTEIKLKIQYCEPMNILAEIILDKYISSKNIVDI
jgi:UDP-N-acetylglucosamine--N-acetylmuramyl-(pentapeptide) pyrophosphoryl-undecaprenol N-acetylglucosamine transferase